MNPSSFQQTIVGKKRTGFFKAGVFACSLLTLSLPWSARAVEPYDTQISTAITTVKAGLTLNTATAAQIQTALASLISANPANAGEYVKHILAAGHAKAGKNVALAPLLVKTAFTALPAAGNDVAKAVIANASSATLAGTDDKTKFLEAIATNAVTAIKADTAKLSAYAVNIELGFFDATLALTPAQKAAAMVKILAGVPTTDPLYLATVAQNLGAAIDPKSTASFADLTAAGSYLGLVAKAGSKLVPDYTKSFAGQITTASGGTIDSLQTLAKGATDLANVTALSESARASIALSLIGIAKTNFTDTASNVAAIVEGVASNYFANGTLYPKANQDALRATFVAAMVKASPAEYAGTIADKGVSAGSGIAAASAPAFATTVVKAVVLAKPVDKTVAAKAAAAAINAANVSNMAGRTADNFDIANFAALTGDIGFIAKAEITQAVVKAQTVFAVDIVKEVVSEVLTDLSVSEANKDSFALAFAEKVSTVSLLLTPNEATLANIALGIAKVRPATLPDVAAKVASKSGKGTPTVKTVAAVGTNVIKGVAAGVDHDTAVQNVAGKIAAVTATDAASAVDVAATLLGSFAKDLTNAGLIASGVAKTKTTSPDIQALVFSLAGHAKSKGLAATIAAAIAPLDTASAIAKQAALGNIALADKIAGAVAKVSLDAEAKDIAGAATEANASKASAISLAVAAEVTSTTDKADVANAVVAKASAQAVAVATGFSKLTTLNDAAKAEIGAAIVLAAPTQAALVATPFAKVTNVANAAASAKTIAAVNGLDNDGRALIAKAFASVAKDNAHLVANEVAKISVSANADDQVTYQIKVASTVAAAVAAKAQDTATLVLKTSLDAQAATGLGKASPYAGIAAKYSADTTLSKQAGPIAGKAAELAATGINANELFKVAKAFGETLSGSTAASSTKLANASADDVAGKVGSKLQDYINANSPNFPVGGDVDPLTVQFGAVAVALSHFIPATDATNLKNINAVVTVLATINPKAAPDLLGMVLTDLTDSSRTGGALSGTALTKAVAGLKTAATVTGITAGLLDAAINDALSNNGPGDTNPGNPYKTFGNLTGDETPVHNG